MKKTSLILLTAASCLATAGIATTLNITENNTNFAAEGKEYTLTFDASGRQYPGSSYIYVNTENGNLMTLEPLNCVGRGETAICDMQDNGSYLTGKGFQNITKIDITYLMSSKQSSPSLRVQIAGEDSSNRQTFNMLDGVELNTKVTNSFEPDTTNAKTWFKLSSMSGYFTIYSITVHYTCE